MFSLFVGIVTQLCVLLSVHYMFRPLEAEADKCRWSGTGAARGLLVISQGLGTLTNPARGKVEYEQTLVQVDELYPVLAGIPHHVVFRHLDPVDSILNGIDVVVYGGPEGMVDNFQKTSEVISFTYPRSCISKENFLKCDEYVLSSIHHMLDTALLNTTMRELLGKKVLFLLYLTSVSIVNLKKPNNISAIQHNTDIIRNAVESVYLHIDEFYLSDSKTTGIFLPNWSIIKDKYPYLSLFGYQASNKFSSTIELVDVCPLLASLLGIQIPTESIGRVPLSYLNMSLEEDAKALACNTLQLHQRVFSPELSKRDQNILTIIEQIEKKQYAECERLSTKVMDMTLSQLYKSQTRFDRTIFSLAIFTLIGWIFVLITEPIAAFTGYLKLPRKQFLFIIASFASVAICEFLYVTFSWPHPLLYLIYMHVSLAPWFLILTRYRIIWDWCLAHANVETLLCTMSMILLEEVIIFCFDNDFVLIFLMTICGSLPLLSHFQQTPFVYSMGWYACCSAILGLLKVPTLMIKPRTKLINGAATFWLCYAQSTVFVFDFKYDSIISQVLVFYILFSAILSNAYAVLPSVPSFFRYISWTTFTALLFPFFCKQKVERRLIQVSLSFGPSLLLLSRDIESLSFAVLMLFVVCWVFLERSYMKTWDNYWCDLRRGVLLVTSCSIGYLLTGRIEEQEPASLLAPFLPLHQHWNDPLPLFAALLFKYVAVFTMVMTVYVSLIKNKWKTDMGYVYGLLLIEIICLRNLIRFSFARDMSKLISEHIFINMFAISYIVAYWWALIYSTKYVKEEITDLNNLDTVQFSVQ